MFIKHKSFTLLEVMLAVAILLPAIVTLLFVTVSCKFLSESNSNRITACTDAQHVLEQIKDLDYSAIDDYTPATFTNLNSEAVAVTTNETGSLTEVTVDVSWTERSQTKTFSLITKIAQ